MKENETMSAPQGEAAVGPDGVNWSQTLAGKIKPNYAHIRKVYLIIGTAGAALILLMQIALFIMFKLPNTPLEFKTSEFVHLLKYLIIPSTLNISALIWAWMVNKFSKNEGLMNVAPVFAVSVMCASAASAHQVYSVTMILLCLPIFMVAVYGQPKMLRLTTCFSLAGLVSAIICRALSPYRKDSLDTKFVPEIIIAFALIVITTVVAHIMFQLLDKQKFRLIEAAKSAQIARQQALEANNAKSEFLANMSHEIRTPLNAVIGMTEMIMRKSKEPEVLEYAGDIQLASNALLAIINDILDISKIESGKMEIRETNYELGSLINDSYNLVASRWKEKGLTAVVQCDANLPRMLCGDEYHLRQIIVNLLTNAIKYTHDGGIEFIVSGEENGDILKMIVRIKDTGVGIKEEDLPKLFDKFIRFDVDKNRQIQGSGLGLSITKRLVELMNGTIEVESVYGIGSTFTVRVPQKIVDRTPIGDIHTTYMDMHGAVEQYHQKFEAPDATILVVDDVSINLTVIAKLLEATKIKVDTASSGYACLKKVCQTKYDIILMDHMMPDLDGVETLERMNQLDESLNHGVPVIMLTANAMVGAREEYLEKGFVDYLEKPVHGARLENMLLRYIPKEKIISQTVATTAKNATLALSDIPSVLPELDTATGISFCADDENFYISMLVEFAASGRDKKLEEHFKAKDWKNYQIEAHSLKSAAKMIGLTVLSEESLGLEMAAKNGDEKYILENHSKVVAHIKAVVKVLKKINASKQE